MQVYNMVEENDPTYNMVVGGPNPQAPVILSILGETLFTIQRFRDAGYDKDRNLLWIFTRTGTTRHLKEYQNERLSEHKQFHARADDSCDRSYELWTFQPPDTDVLKALKHHPLPVLTELMKAAKVRQDRGEWNKYEIEFARKLGKEFGK